MTDSVGSNDLDFSSSANADERFVRSQNDKKDDVYRFYYNSWDSDDDIDLRSLFMIFWNRRLLIIFLIFIGISLSLYLTSKLKPIYAAEAYILVELQKDSPPELTGFLKGLNIKDSVILSEAQILRSRSFALRAIERMNLLEDEEFGSLIAQPNVLGSFFKPIKERFQNFLVSQGVIEKEDITDTNNPPSGTVILDRSSQGEFKALRVGPVDSDLLSSQKEAQKEQVVTQLLEALKINVVSGSNVISIQVQAHSPAKAAYIANEYADLYLEERIRLKVEEKKKLSQWLDDRLNELKLQVRRTEQEVARYRVENNLVTSMRGEITGEQLTQLSSELIRAKGDVAAIDAKLKQISGKKTTLNNLLSVPDVIKSNSVRELKIQEIDLMRQRADLKTKYGNRHPSVININNELSVLRDRLLEEAKNILVSVQEEASIAKARVEALERGFRDLINVREEESEAMIKLRELMMEAESSRALYDTFLQSFKRSTSQEKLQDPEARVISYAPVPLHPIYPNKMLFASLSAFLMLFLGISLALFLEKLDAAFKTVSQLEKFTRFPCFGVIPDIRIRDRKKTVSMLWTKTSHHASEMVRNLRTTLSLRGRLNGKAPKVITITSSVPAEGKSTLSTWLSLVTAKSGDRVCLIDCDLRSPVIHQHISGRPKNTLVEFLTNQANLEDILVKDKKTGLYTIFAKSVPNSAHDLISSKKMKTLIQSLREEFDLIILDAPSCLSVSDPKILANMSDQTLYAVAWGRTERDQVLLGLKQFVDIDYYNIATVFSRVNFKNYARLGYGDVEY